MFVRISYLRLLQAAYVEELLDPVLRHVLGDLFDLGLMLLVNV